MIVKNAFNNDETYTHTGWVYRDVNVGFSRLYYILDGEGYYEEGGKSMRFKKGYLYLTPVKKPFTLYDNPSNRLLHTYTHIYTFPAINEFTEVKVEKGTHLYEAVELWRKHVKTKDLEFLAKVVQFLLSCIEGQLGRENSVARATKRYLDALDGFSFTPESLCRSVGYTREHITRCFLSVYSMTPHQYLNKIRMDTALDALLNGAKVCDISAAVGYANAYSFSKAFKKHFGMSPKLYLQTINPIIK